MVGLTRYARVTATFFLTIGLLVLGVACKSKEEKSATVPSPQSAYSLDDTLVARLPKNIIGFGYFNFLEQSYQQFLSSPWGKKSSDWMTLAQTDPQFQEMRELFERFGLDLSDPKSPQKLITEAAFFVLPDTEEVPIGLLFRSPSKEKLDEVSGTLQKELKTRNKKVVAFEEEGISGLTITVPETNNAQGVTTEAFDIIFARKEDRGVFAWSKSLAKTALEAEAGQPALLADAEFLKATKNLSAEKSSYGLGYLDFDAILAWAKKRYPEVADNQEALDAAAGLQSVSWVLGFTESPEQEIRVRFNESGAESLNKISVSEGDVLAKYVPTQPMAVLSVDAGILQPIVATMKSKKGAPIDVEKQFPWLKDVKKLAISLSVGAPGILPVPKVALALQVNNAKEVEELLKGMLGQMIAASGMVPNAQWQAKEQNGATLQTMMGPMGLSLALTSTEDVVLLGNNIQELGEMFAGSSKVPARVAANITPPRVFTINVDFDQVATFMQTMSGVLGMYAPQDENTKQMLSEEAIAQVRQLGIFSGHVERQEDMLVIASKYYKN